MTALWTRDQVLAAVDGVARGPDWRADGVSIDSRTVAAGDLFVALVGPTFDGHDFVADALARGAAAALVQRVPDGLAADAPLILVPDTLAALAALGRAGRDRTRARVVAVTGSVGKTGTKEALRLGLGAQAKTAFSAASLNNHWGLPLSLARVPPDAAYVVQEIGMNHAGEIAALAPILRPDVAVITTIEPVHIEFFPSVEAIADAKAEIFQAMTSGGTAVLNRDNAHFDRLADHARARGIHRILDFGTGEHCFARLVAHDLMATCSAVTAVVGGRRIDYSIGVPGRHWVTNSLAVLAAVHALGADVGIAAAQLAKLSGLAGRGARHTVALPDGNTFTMIDESYNANPASVRAAIEVLAATRPAPGGRRIAVLGDMRELGDFAPRAHLALVEPLVAARVDLVLCCGPHMSLLHAALPPAMRGGHQPTAADLAPLAAAAVRPGDVVTVKGSLGTGMAPIVKRLLGGPWSAPSQARVG